MGTSFYADETVAVPLLTKMSLPRFAILEVLSSVAGERANVKDGIDPPSATGYETWRWGTRFLREHETLTKLGWQVCERDQVSGIYHPVSNIKLTMLPTDNRTGSASSPRSVTNKGPATCKMVGRNSAQGTFGFMASEPPQPVLWCLCAYFCDLYIAAEVSRPITQVGGFVCDYSDRIIIAKPFEIPGTKKRHSVPEDFAEVARPVVKRKT